MKMKNNDTLMWLCLWFAIVILGALFFMRECSTPPNIEKVDTVFSTKTDTLWKDTTIVKKEYVPTIVEKLQIDTVYDSNGDTIQLIVEAKKWEDSIVSNKDTAYLQIFTSGIRTSVDSTKIRLKTHTEVITNTVEITKIVEKKKTVWDRFHIGLQAGYGYGFQYKGLEPYVGIGGSFDL